MRGKRLFQQLIGPLDYVLDLPEINARFIVLDNSGNYLTLRTRSNTCKTELSVEHSLKFVIMHVPPQTHKWIDESHVYKGGRRIFADAFRLGTWPACFTGITIFTMKICSPEPATSSPAAPERRLPVCISGILPIILSLSHCQPGRSQPKKYWFRNDRGSIRTSLKFIWKMTSY